MNKLTASLLVRQHLALVQEGIGPVNPEPYDLSTLRHAAEVCFNCGNLSAHDAWEANLIDIDDIRHPKNHDGCNGVLL